MKTSLAKFIIIAATAFLLGACGNTTPDDVKPAPNLDFECSFAQALGCDPSNAGKPVFIGLDENLAVNCKSQLSFYSGEALTRAFDFSSQTVATESGGILTGVATHWVNSLSMPMILLPHKTYRVCAYIDLNDNGTLDLNEPVEDSTIAIGSPFLPLSNWSNY